MQQEAGADVYRVAVTRDEKFAFVLDWDDEKVSMWKLNVDV